MLEALERHARDVTPANDELRVIDGEELNTPAGEQIRHERL
jgi:hypothetical protein